MPQASDVLATGFDNPVHQSQQVFRHVLQAMSRPGLVVTLPDSRIAPNNGLSAAATQIALALLDFETPVWLDSAASESREFLAFHCGCPITDAAERAQYLLFGKAQAFDRTTQIHIGTDEHPEQAATVIIDVAGILNDGGQRLIGPGIDGVIELEVAGAPASLWQRVADNATLFPRGVDLILTSGNRLAALPRSTRLEA